ncbi:PR domain zinc finger protein 10-like [Octopus vulgaris]|uniref:PR domain zinc finger protein 10-like n=1 Tax=Octopus vulgaris TaxID=6645 RepID=A0AA36BEG1_OCTVU|nr:PR domain zinc finger protein 10-like [Octopus vulgaris]
MDGIWCHECGRSNNRDCPEHGPLQDIPDRVIPPMAHLTLPKGLVIRPNLKTHPLKVSERGVFAKRVIPARSKFGPVVAPPFPADANYTPVQTNSLILKVFNGGESIQSVVTLDMTDNGQCNWMMFVRSACLADTQQNLEAYQCDGKIYFVAIRTIHIGDELRVGYAANYARLMLEKSCLTVSDSVLSDINTGSGISEDSSVESHTVQQDNSYDEGMETVSTESDVKGELPQLPFPSDVVRVLERSRPRRHFSFTSSRATGSKSSVAAKVCKENISIDNVIHGTKSKDLKIERNVDIRSSATPLEAGGIGNQNLKRVTRSSKATFGQMLLGTSDTDDVGSKITKLALISPPSVMRKRSRKNECVSCKLERRGGHGGGNNNNCSSGGSGRMCAHGRKVLHRCTTENCSKVFVSKFLLDRHMLIHSAPRNHKCFFCEKSFGRRDHLTSHLNTHKPDKPTWVCKQCGKQYISRFMHKTHMAMHAAEKGKINNCPICNKKYDNKDDLLLHLKIHGGIVYPKGLDKTHKCLECSKVFAKRKDMKRHLVVHSRKKEYKCIYCSQLFSRRGHLNLHFQRFHSHPADCGEICSSSSSSVSTNAVSLPAELLESCHHDANRDEPHLANVLIPDASSDSLVAETTNTNPVSTSDVAMAATLPDSNSTKCDDDEDDDEDDDDDDDDDDDVVGDDESKMSPPPQTALSRLSISDKDFSPEEVESMKLYKSSFNPTLFSKNPFEKASCSEVPGLSSDVIQYVSTDSSQSTASRGVPRPASGTVPPSSPVSSHQHQQGCSTTYPCTPEKSGLASSTATVSPPLLSLSNIETTQQHLYDVQKKQLYTPGTVPAATSLSDTQLNKDSLLTPSSAPDFDTTTATGAKSQHREGDRRLAACQKYLEQLQLYREGLAPQPNQDKTLSAPDATCESSSSMWPADATDSKQLSIVDHTNTKSF